MTEEGLVKRFEFELLMGRFKPYADFDTGIVYVFRFMDIATYDAFRKVLTKLNYRDMNGDKFPPYVYGIVIDTTYKCWRYVFAHEEFKKTNKVPKYIDDYARGELKRYYD